MTDRNKGRVKEREKREIEEGGERNENERENL